MKVNLHDLAFLDQAKNILAREICQGIYEFLAEGPGVAHGEKQYLIFLEYVTPRLPLSVHKKMSAHSVQCSRLASDRENVYECLVLLYRWADEQTNK